MLRVFIIGTTGVGKTKLSIQLAKHLKGEVISSDSKQLYRHATIMTAKVTEEEAEGVPHYMVDALRLHQNTYNRNKYFSEAFSALQQIEAKDKTPIIVGGTNYYTQTLLYDLAIADRINNSEQEEQQDNNSIQQAKDTKKELDQEDLIKVQELRTLSKQQKYDLLKKYDNLIAEKVHKNNQQKINLFLQRIITTKRKISDSYLHLTHKLRFNNTLVFWLRNSDKEELLGMVTKRIHKMLDQAGITEILAIYHYLHLHRAQQGKEQQVNYEKYSGAASSIGIKQFLPLYLETRQQLLNLIPLKENQKVDYQQIHGIILKHFQDLKYSQQVLSKCREQLIMDTKHYCKRQITWIRNRMFLQNDNARKHFFVLDLQQTEGEVMDIHQRFENQIRKKAAQIIESVKQYGFGHIIEEEGHFAQNKSVPLEEWKKFYCQACKLELNGQFDWGMHLKSKRHIKKVKYEEKKEDRAEYIATQKALGKKKKIEQNEEMQAKEIESIYQKRQQ